MFFFFWEQLHLHGGPLDGGWGSWQVHLYGGAAMGDLLFLVFVLFVFFFWRKAGAGAPIWWSRSTWAWVGGRRTYMVEPPCGGLVVLFVVCFFFEEGVSRCTYIVEPLDVSLGGWQVHLYGGAANV